MPTPPNGTTPRSAQQARHDIAEIRPLLEGVLDPAVLARLIDRPRAPPSRRSDDELWVRIVYAFLEATNRGSASIEHLADMFVPIYMWRAARFMSHTAHEPVGRRADAAQRAVRRISAPEASARQRLGRSGCEVAMIQEIADALVAVVAKLRVGVRAVRAAAGRRDHHLRRRLRRGAHRAPRRFSACSSGSASIGCRAAAAPARCCAWPRCRRPNC